MNIFKYGSGLHFRVLKSEKGMSLAASLVAVSIAGTVILVASTAVSQALEMMGHDRKVQAIEEFTETLSALMNDVRYCSANLSEVAISPNPNSDFRPAALQFRHVDQDGNAFGQVVYSRGSEIERGVQIQDFQYRTLVQAGNQLHGVTRVVFNLNSRGLVNNVYRDIHFSVLVDNPSAAITPIQRCGSGGALRAGMGPKYSATCQDWAAAGWESLDQCIRDGRWHLVFHNAQNGGSVSGNLNALRDHIRRGASVRVATDEWRSTEDCQNAYTDGGRVHCLGGMRFAGEDPGSIGEGAPRYSTDGGIWCLVPGHPSANGCGGGLTSGYRWFVRY